MRRFWLLATVALVVFGCKDASETNTNTNTDTTISDDANNNVEQYRSRFHFTPQANWMNDPNGLVYFDDTYHLFYQYYPHGTVWGPMHWGHAVSKDLLNWEHKPIALYPDKHGYIFSGSAVIDKQNTAGFGENAMVAVYTYHNANLEKENSILYQTQGIAYSTDKGETWTKYKNNPVLDNPGIKDFRDPKVFWNVDKLKWQMLLAAKDHIQIYESNNLKNWAKISEFRLNDNPPLGVWECPDLFKLTVEGSTEEKWVLIISHGGESSPNGGSGTRYFVGDYDGTTFTTNQKVNKWIDYGTDNYAGVTYNNTPNNKRIFIGWMSNWNYATVTPTETWRSAMTLPRELKLIKNDNGYLVKSKLIDGFDNLTSKVPEAQITGTYPTKFSYSNLQHSVVAFNATINTELSLELSNKDGDTYTVGYNKNTGEFFVNRGKSGHVDFNENYKKSAYQTMQIGTKEQLSITMVLDASSVEIFINNGEYVMTTQVFPNSDFTNFEIKNPKGITINNFEFKEVKK